MKKNRKEKQYKENKSVKKIIKRSVLLIFLVILIAFTVFSIYCTFRNVKKSNTIIATKIVTENEQEQKIKYTIKIKNYEIQSAIKELTFKTKEEAQAQYNRYETINLYERREIGLELKGKKLILTMPIKQLTQDIEWNENKIIIQTKNGQEKETIDQIELKKCLIDQGYEIK